MSDFNLQNYEPVKERKARFLKDYPDGRIVVEQVSLPEQIENLAEFKAFLYKNVDEQEKGLPFSTGHALEIRIKELSVSSTGKTYEAVNYTSWTENAEESAVGRALDNAGYAGAPSREEMKKVLRHEEVLNTGGNTQTKKFDTSWKDKKPTLPQITAVLRKAAYKKEIHGIEETEALKKEVTDWNAGLVSDYIGNKIELDEARKLVHAGE